MQLIWITNIFRLFFFLIQEIGDLYELEQNSDKAIMYFEKAADYFEFQESNSLANKCKLKVAEISAQLEQ
jgi:alpha-soluble NSF attachment protein